MSKMPFPILNFLGSDVCAVMTLIFLKPLFVLFVVVVLFSFGLNPLTAHVSEKQNNNVSAIHTLTPIF